MTEERREILRMLAEGKISIEEAEMLLDALGDTGEAHQSAEGQRENQQRHCGAFFGDFDFNFDDICGDVFSHFGDMFGGFAKGKYRGRTHS